MPSNPLFFRPCPADFVEVYLRIGWDGIEDHFHAHKTVIKRWVGENGGDELKARRREAVRASRRSRAGPVADGVSVAPATVAEAAHFLRGREGGGWMVSATGKGDWRVGTMRKTPAEVVEMARRRGFSPAL
jgi:hypothetical protein